MKTRLKAALLSLALLTGTFGAVAAEPAPDQAGAAQWWCIRSTSTSTRPGAVRSVTQITTTVPGRVCTSFLIWRCNTGPAQGHIYSVYSSANGPRASVQTRLCPGPVATSRVISAYTIPW